MSTPPDTATPALFNRISTLPKLFITVSTAFLTLSSLVTSHSTNNVLTLYFLISASTSLSLFIFLANNATFAPIDAYDNAA